MLFVKNPLFLKQSDVFISGLLPLWMNVPHVDPFSYENAGPNAAVVSDRYRIVFLLDCSLSMNAVDTTTGIIKSSLAFETLCKCFTGLLQPFSKSRLLYRFSVIAHGSSSRSNVIIQDIQPTRDNINEFLKEIYDAVLEFENGLLKTENTDLFSTFELGLTALDLLPKDYLPVLVFITDGVSVARSSAKIVGKSHLPMRLVYGKVSLSIVQVGSENGYKPNTQFGHVADNELLRFICILLSGRFLYASDTPHIFSEDYKPNFYHVQLLFRGTDYSRVVSLNVDSERYVAIQGNTPQRLVDIPRSRVINSADNKPSTTLTLDELDYPWKLNSLPPIISEILTSVREYSLSSSICASRLITARIREGFILRSINISKRNKIEVTLTKPWDLHVTILYTIKAYKGWSSFFSINPDSVPSETGKPLKVEVNVLAHHSFAILFVNMYMIGQTTNPAIENLYLRLMRLDEHLKEMYALDDAMPTISSIEYFYYKNLESKSKGTMTAELFSKELKDYFIFIHQNISSFRSIFDTWKTDWILYSRASVIGKKRQVAAIFLTEFLSKWACVTIDRHTYCKMIINDRKYEIQGSPKSYGFVIVKLSMKTEFVATSSLYFYNSHIEERSKVIQSLQAELDRSHFQGTASKVMTRCKRPLHNLMVSYNLVENNLIISNIKVRDVLLQSRWIWWKKGDSLSLLDRVVEIVDALYRRRVSEGFTTVFQSSNCISFYMEHEYCDVNCSTIKICSIQYLILVTDSFIATELWSEPLKRTGDSFPRNYLHLELKNRIFRTDFNVLTYYKTYSVIDETLRSAEDEGISNEIHANISKCISEPIENGDHDVYIHCNLVPVLNKANISLMAYSFSYITTSFGAGPTGDMKIGENLSVFSEYFLNSLKSNTNGIQIENVSEDYLFLNYLDKSLSDDIRKFDGKDLRFCDCSYFVKQINSDRFAIILVPSSDCHYSCESLSDLETLVKTPVVIYECFANLSDTPGENISFSSLNTKFKHVDSDSHLFLSRGDDSSESRHIKDLILYLARIYYESWFRTACYSISNRRKIDFRLNDTILSHCSRKVERFDFAYMLSILTMARSTSPELNIAEILNDWISVDASEGSDDITLWTHSASNEDDSTESPPNMIDQYFVNLAIEGQDEFGKPIFYPLRNQSYNFSDVFQSVSPLMVGKIFYSGNSGKISLESHIKSYVNAFALRKSFGLNIDISIIKKILDELIAAADLPHSIRKTVINKELDILLIGHEDVQKCHFLEICEDLIADEFLMSVKDDTVSLRLKEDSRFWLFIEFLDGVLYVKGYHFNVSKEEETDVMCLLNVLVGKLAFRANQLTLLKDMNENRLASDFLINPEIVGIQVGSLSTDLRYTFDVGAFACPQILTYEFQLHHRVTVEHGLNVINTTMQPFSILNRPGMFVSLQKEPSGKLSIYYMHFDTHSGTSKSDNNTIILKIFGIEKPNTNGFRELIDMIHSKLDAFSINLLSSWISRYGVSKLLQDDYELLLPLHEPPIKSLIHKCETDPYALLTMIQRKFIGSFCSLIETPKAIIDKYFSNYFSSTSKSSSSYCHHITAYNCSSSREPTDFEKQIDHNCSPIEWKEPTLPLSNQSVNVLIALWPHESLSLDLLMKQALKLVKEAHFDLSFLNGIGQLYLRSKSHDHSLDYADFVSIDESLIVHRKHHDINHYDYHLNIESHVEAISGIIKEEIVKLRGGALFLKQFQKLDRGNEVQIILAGFFLPQKAVDLLPELSSNDIQLASLSNVNDSHNKEYREASTSISYSDMFSLEFFVISLQKTPHISTYHAPDLVLDLNRILFRWCTYFDFKNQKVVPILFPGSVVNIDRSHLAAIDAFEPLIYNPKDRKSYDSFEREIHLLKWTAFPLINHQLNEMNGDKSTKRYEWNLRYQKEILQTFGIMVKAHKYEQTQSMKHTPLRIDHSKISSFERYYYHVDESGLLRVIHSNIRDSYCYISHFLISKKSEIPEENLLRRLVVELFGKHVKLTAELIESKDPGIPNILEKLKTLHETFPKAPAGSRTFLVKGIYSPIDQNVSSSLFQYIFLNPQRYGFLPLLDSSGCYLRSSTPDFRCKPLSKTSIDGEEFEYILIVYSNRQQATEPKLKYYIIVLNLSSLSVDEDLSTSEYIGGGYYLGDIVRYAEKRLTDLLSTSLKFYSRDSLWRQLQHSAGSICTESSEWITLFLEKISPNSRTFVAVDPNLEDLFSNSYIDWERVLDHLSQVFKAHLLYQDSTTHYIQYNDSNSDYLVHLAILNNACEAYIVSREGVSDPVEWEAIDGIVNEILLFLVNEY